MAAQNAGPSRRSGRREQSYTCAVEQLPTNEDFRGVDIGQIRRQLCLSVPERVRTMVEVANVMLGIQQNARGSLQRQVR